MTTDTLAVDLGDRSYDILVGEGLLARAGERLQPLLPQPRVVVVSDANVAPLYLERLAETLAASGIEAETITLPAGEATKSLEQFGELLETILEKGVERGTTLVALGGGVIGDITGFAAAATLRGVPFVQIPTTLLSQVDSSVGGKTGINSRVGKNLIGAFYQPRLVLIDVDSLDSLPQRELLAGYAEVAKYGLIDDAGFFAWLEENGPALVDGDKALRRRAILTSCAAKAKVVAADEREAGQRALLNLGHTFGHAFEAETGYGDTLLHGEAVAIGMVMAFDLSARMGLCQGADLERVKAHLKAVGLPVDLRAIVGDDWSVDRLLGHMAKDKKVQDGKVTFVLARGIGEAFLSREVDPGLLRGMLADWLTEARG